MTATTLAIGFREFAIQLAVAGWPIFPLSPRSKVPMIAGGHGHRDGTNDLATVEGWWRRWPLANIGARVLDGLVVLDVDPRSGGDDSLAALVKQHGELPPTLAQRTGSGGHHYIFQRPAGPLEQSAHRLGRGLDVKVGSLGGYIVVPPSVHPDGGTYEWCTPILPPATMPDWMTTMLRPAPKAACTRPSLPQRGVIADFDDCTAWADVLVGWTFVRSVGDNNHWCRPGKAHATSATISKNGTGVLYVFTSNAPPLEPGRWYSKFAAWAALHGHGDDLASAARALRGRP